MIKRRPDLPAGHGELVTEPPVSEWAQLLQENAEQVAGWDFCVAGVPVADLRKDARRILTAKAKAWSDRLGIETSAPPTEPSLIVATGHQPDLYHTGVWAKDFLLQRLATQTGATAVDVVVDSDVFDHVGIRAPCFSPGIVRCEQYLATGGPATCFACSPTPGPDDIELFCKAAAATLDTLPSPSAGLHFASYCEGLRDSVSASENLAELMTAARRRYEGDLTDYLELPVTAAAASEPFVRFAVDICLSARRFAAIHNDELASHRALHRLRSSARPFPDLVVDDEVIELPFWLLRDGSRSGARIREASEGLILLGPDGDLVTLPADPSQAVPVLLGSGIRLVPRALTLTLFVRTFLADLFIHGIGGSRYDRVTEAVAHRWWGIELPQFVTASLTMYLPLGAYLVTEDDLAEVDQRLHRLAHNPDEALGDIDFDSPGERDRALSLAGRKRDLVEKISAEGADRKVLGAEIREVNAELAALLDPLAGELRSTRDRLSVQIEASGVLADRTYPFCLWSPEDVADKVW